MVSVVSDGSQAVSREINVLLREFCGRLLEEPAVPEGCVADKGHAVPEQRRFFKLRPKGLDAVKEWLTPALSSERCVEWLGLRRP